VEFALKRSDMGKQFADYLKSLDLFAAEAVGEKIA
jgi:hypothetical protein